MLSLVELWLNAAIIVNGGALGNPLVLFRFLEFIYFYNTNLIQWIYVDTYDRGIPMRYVKTVSILFLLVGFVFVLAPGKSTNAGTSGEILSVCKAQGRTQMAIWALGDIDDGGGFDNVGAQVVSAAGVNVITSAAIPADGEYHLVEFTLDTSSFDLNEEVFFCAGDIDAAGLPVPPGFSGCGVAVLDACLFEAPVPKGFTQRSLSCTSPVLDGPAGRAVGDNTVKAGQVWYVNPKPVVGSDGLNYTEIFVGGPVTGYIPTACIGGATPFSTE